LLTYGLQWVVALGSLGFAGAALWVAGNATSADPFHRAAWRMTGAAFLLHGVGQVIQYSWGGKAMLDGAASFAMISYLRWAPALNHSRTFLLLGFCAALVAFAVRKKLPDSTFWLTYSGTLLVAIGVGAVLGFNEGSLVVRRHFLSVAGWDTVELLVLLVALLAVLMADRIDRLLWAALATYAFSVALSILWFTVLSSFGAPGEWTPSPWHVAAYRAVAMFGTCAFALRRVHAALHDYRVPGMSPRRSQPGLVSIG
jgi:hypothetical protein